MSIKDRIAKLIDLKSILSLVVIIGMTVGFFKGMILPEMYMTVVTSIITFYFAKADKKEETKEYQGEE